MKIWTHILIAVFALSALFLYFVPTIIAFKNRHPKRIMIFLVDLILGVTIFGWIGALLWATDKKPVADR